MKENKEQFEAKEINTRPRLVITTEGMMVFPDESSPLAMNKDQVQAAICLRDLLAGESKK